MRKVKLASVYHLRDSYLDFNNWKFMLDSFLNKKTHSSSCTLSIYLLLFSVSFRHFIPLVFFCCCCAYARSLGFVSCCCSLFLCVLLLNSSAVVHMLLSNNGFVIVPFLVPLNFAQCRYRVNKANVCVACVRLSIYVLYLSACVDLNFVH